MTVQSVLLKLMYPPPASVLINAMSVISFLSLSNGGWMETKGKNMQYSKMRNNNNNNVEIKNDDKKKEKAKVPSKLGMFVLYTPAFVAGLSSFLLFPIGDFRFDLIRSAITAHFFKRVFEVLFVHKYSGWMDVEAMFPISFSYFSYSAIMIYNQDLTTQALSEPAIDLKCIGISMFLVGIVGNFYHHYLLSKLRTNNGEKRYKIPKDGLFSLVICPHYLFEVVEFLGISCISQTLYAFLFTMGTTFYLMGRSYSTRKWYESKFEDFPREVKALIPYIF